ncbi:MAG: hypothetical protein H6Q71_2865, partial [Firmicutes bacterium]|nr:hypothetical protein [Bacillota bacterium]
KVPNFKPLCGKICEQVLANVLGKARTKPASNNSCPYPVLKKVMLSVRVKTRTYRINFLLSVIL